MKKVFGFFVLVSTALVLISCGGGGGGGGGGGAAPAAAATSNTYTGSFSVNGTNYSSLTIGNGKYTLAGNNGTDTGTYVSETAAYAIDGASAVRASTSISIENGTFVLTSRTHSGTWKMTIGGNGGNSISFHNGSLSASGTGTVVSQGGSLIGRWFLPDPDPDSVLADGGVELEFKNNSQLVARVTLEGYDNQGRWRQFPGSVTFPYTATENTITLTNTLLDFDIGGLTDEEEILLMLAIMFFGDDMDVDAGDGSTDTNYYAVKGNLLIMASDAALTEEVEVATRR